MQSVGMSVVMATVFVSVYWWLAIPWAALLVLWPPSFPYIYAVLVGAECAGLACFLYSINASVAAGRGSGADTAIIVVGWVLLVLLIASIGYMLCSPRVKAYVSWKKQGPPEAPSEA